MRFRVAVVQPVYGYMPAKCHADQMMWYGVSCRRGFLDGTYVSVTNYDVAVARNKLVKTFIDDKTITHLMWLDHDMRLPWSDKPGEPDTMTHLLGADKDVASGIYFARNDEATIVAWDSLEPPARMTDFNPKGLQKVAGIGMGGALTRLDVFRRMRDRYGDEKWFACENCGEDYWFCRRCGEMGIEIWLDGQLQYGHLAEGESNYERWKVANGKVGLHS